MRQKRLVKKNKTKEKVVGLRSTLAWALVLWILSFFTLVSFGIFDAKDMFTDNDLFVIYFTGALFIILFVLLMTSFLIDFTLGSLFYFMCSKWKRNEELLLFLFFIIKFLIMGAVSLFLILAALLPLSFASL